jgi:hypothetical protein
VIVALAILGAAVVVLGGVLRARSTGSMARLAQFLIWAGYTMSGISVVLFIAAGFTSSN